MAVIPIKSFGGIAPKVPPRFLPDTSAQVASNCVVFNGSLQPLTGVGTAVATLTKSGTPLTIYRFGQDIISTSQYWFHWTTDVDVCRSQIPGDTSEWTFYTDGTLPKATYSTLALSGSDYPTVSRPLGIPAPTTALTLTLGGTPTDATALPETRVYTYTLVNKESGYDFESAPAPASESIDVKVGETVAVTNFDTIPSGYTATHRRIYRSVSGTYLFVAEVTAATTSYTDSVLAEDLGEELPSLTWLPPPATMRGLINLPNGIMAGFVGRDIYFCDPYHPHAWPIAYNQTVDYPVVGLGRMDTTLAVLTTGTPYFLQGSHPDSMVVVKSDLDQACASKRSIVSANGVVMYASPDGLVMLSPGGSKLVSEGAFTYAQWQALFNPSSIHAYMHDRKYVAFYNNGGTTGGFIFDLLTGQFTLHGVYATAGYTDLVNDKLFLAFSDRTVKVWQAGSALSYIWTSKKFTMPYEMTYSCSQVEAEAYPVTAKYYVDGTLVHTQTVANRKPFRLPVIVGRDWEFRIEGNTEVFSVATAQSMQELAGV
jgi:hypothetical protein